MAKKPNKRGKKDEPAAQNLPQQAQASYEQGRRSAYALERNIETYARQKPLKAIALAAGLGLVLGMLWSSRR
jgi:ElaB/YqjD/DUF883 family membrane-anchored ribosome-binding protein